LNPIKEENDGNNNNDNNNNGIYNNIKASKSHKLQRPNKFSEGMELIGNDDVYRDGQNKELTF